MVEGNLKNRIRKAQEGDEKVVKAVEEVKKAGIKTLRDEEWEIEDGIIMKEGRIYVPEGELRSKVIRLHHDTLVGGHGCHMTENNIISFLFYIITNFLLLNSCCLLL